MNGLLKFVRFAINGVELCVEAREPEDMDIYRKEECVITEEERYKILVNNAINDIKNKLNVDLTCKVEDIYDYVEVVFQYRR